MTRVHIVSDGFRSSNSRALLHPILRHKRPLEDLGLSVRVFSGFAAEVGECDTLAIDGKALRDRWGPRSEETLEQLAELRKLASRLYFFDTTDSAGFLVGEILPHVDKYFKNQLLIDRDAYTRPMYGRRLYTDYYHRTFGVVDTDPQTEPQALGPSDLGKLHLSWNAGLANYDAFGLYRAMAYERLALPWLLTGPSGFVAPEGHRDIAIHTRMGVNYPRQTIAWQRQEIAKRLTGGTEPKRVGRRAYLRELARSRLVLAPFGWGEFTYKDYETFIAGGLLIKPDMSHMETWPDFYRAGETMLTYSWDLEDLEATIERGLAEPKRSMDMARNAQEIYRHFTATDAGRDEVCRRINSCFA